MGADALPPSRGGATKPRPPKAWIVAGCVAVVVVAAIGVASALLVFGREPDFSVSQLATVTSAPRAALQGYAAKSFIPNRRAGAFIRDVDKRCARATSAAGRAPAAGATDRERRTARLRFMRLLRRALRGARPSARVAKDYRDGYHDYVGTLDDGIAIASRVVRALRASDDDRTLEAGRAQTAINEDGRTDLAELLGFGSCLEGRS